MSPETSLDVYLVDARRDPLALVPAVVWIDVPADRLSTIEDEWRAARRDAAAVVEAGGGSAEHAHWDWRDKTRSVESGRHRLVALDCDGQTQGVMAVYARPMRTAVEPVGAAALYVDFLESAPWNQSIPPLTPRYKAVGTQLVLAAIHMSRVAGWGGRVGLESLPQAERFYRDHCRMTPVGRSERTGLLYFEYTEEQAAAWAAEKGGV